MKLELHMTDATILAELGQRFAAVRLERNLTQAELANMAGVSKRTIERFEAGEAATQLSSLLRICRALGLIERLDSAIPEPVPSPMAQLKLLGGERKRASGKRITRKKPKKWTWGDHS